MALADIVNVVVTKASSSVSRQGFGIPLLAAYHTHWTDRVRTYSASTALAAMVTEGFTTTSAAYKAVQSALSQNPRVRQIKIGRRDTSWTQSVELVPVAASSTVYNGKVNGLAWTFTSDSSATLAEVCTGIAAAITALAGVTADGSSATKVVITADTAATVVNVEHGLGVGVYTFSDQTPNTGVATDLNTIRAADQDWYGLGLDCTGQPAIEAAAAWAETQLVVFGVSSADDGIKNSAVTTDVLSELQDLSLARSFFVFNQNYDSFAGFAALCGGLPYEPGAYDFYAKTIRGVPVSVLTDTEQDNITDKGGNVYVAQGGKNVVLFGVTPGGSFLDDTISIDWVHSRITEDVWSLLTSAPKLPYTDESVDRMRGVVLGVLLLGVRRGIFNAGDGKDIPSPTVDAPRVADVSEVDRANRHLPDVSGSARLAGAIHTTDIAITVSV